jgi:hypothetical protein
MIAKAPPSIIHHFSSIEDPRSKQAKEVSAPGYFFISICAVMRGADNRVAIEEFGLAKKHGSLNYLV